MTRGAMMTRPERHFYQEVGQRIRSARVRHRMTQRDVAIRLGVTPTAISYWENGHHAISLWHLAELERVVGEGIYL